jgi:hypothetical protein
MLTIVGIEKILYTSAILLSLFLSTALNYAEQIMLSVLMLSIIMLSIIMLSIIMPSVIMPSVIMASVIMANVIMASVIMASVIMTSVIILSVIMPNVVILSVMGPHFSLSVLDHRSSTMADVDPETLLEWLQVSILNLFFFVIDAKNQIKSDRIFVFISFQSWCNV